MVGGKARLGVLLAVFCTSAFLYIKYHHLLTISELKNNHGHILAWVDANPALAPLCYIGTLFVVIGLTCPGATMLSFIGGILFKQPYASVYAYIGYITGALCSYMVTTFILGDFMRRRLAEKSSLYIKFEKNVKRNAFGYLVAARFTLVFPFFFVNGAAALVGVKWSTFAAATAVSCIPGAVIYTTAGAALANLLQNIDADNFDKSKLIFMALEDPNVRLCMVFLALALTVMAAVRKLTGDSNGDDEDEKAE